MECQMSLAVAVQSLRLVAMVELVVLIQMLQLGQPIAVLVAVAAPAALEQTQSVAPVVVLALTLRR
jgi:hypothetical protein